MKIMKSLGLYGIGKSLFGGRRGVFGRRRRGLFGRGSNRSTAMALWGGSGLLPAIGYLGWRNRHKLMAMWDRYTGRSSMKGIGQGSRIGAGQPIGRSANI